MEQFLKVAAAGIALAGGLYGAWCLKGFIEQQARNVSRDEVRGNTDRCVEFLKTQRIGDDVAVLIKRYEDLKVKSMSAAEQLEFYSISAELRILVYGKNI